MSSIVRPLRGLYRNISFVSTYPSTSQLVVNFISRFQSTLGQSYVLMQDGIEMREMPWMVKKLYSSEIVGDDNSNKAALNISREKYTSLEKHFKTQLQECNSMQQVISLLEMPGKTITSETAGSVLCRIGMFESNGEHLASLLQRAVLKELSDTIAHDFKTVSNKTLIDLMKCCLKLNSYSPQFVANISEEVELRLSSSTFSILDLCEIVTFLSEHTGSKFNDTLKSCWIHFGSRYLEFNETNLLQVFEVIRYKTSSCELLHLVTKQLCICWERLSPSDVAVACKWLSFFNHHSLASMSAIGKWLYNNIHLVNCEQMKHILGLYLHFKYHDSNVMTAICKFVTAFMKSTMRGLNQSNDRSVIQMVAMYCLQKRLIIKYLLDQIAVDFSRSSNCYDVSEGVSVLKIFGQLGHSPNDKFFTVAEQWLEEKWKELTLPDMIEVLASFTYLERFPINFMQRIFHSKIPKMFYDNPTLKDRMKICQNIMELQASMILEFPRKCFINFVTKEMFHVYLGYMEGSLFKFHKEVAPIIGELVGEDKMVELKNPKLTPHYINFEVTVDPFKNPLMSSTSIPATIGTKIALILAMPSDYTMAGSMMGDVVMKLRHLEKLNYTTVLINYGKFVFARSKSEKVAYISSILEDHINLNELNGS